MIISGKVRSGQGNSAAAMGKLVTHYLHKTGVRFFPGTLNLELPEPLNMPKDVLRLEAREYGGSISINILACRVLGRDAFILRSDLNESGNGDRPKTIIEIATDIKLRDRYHLSDGNEVVVEIESSS